MRGRKCAAVKERYLSRTDTTGRLELRPQDILLPDYDAATVAVGKMRWKVRWTKSPVVLNARYYPALSQLSQHAQTGKTSRRFHTAIANKLREYGLSQKKNEDKREYA